MTDIKFRAWVEHKMINIVSFVISHHQKRLWTGYDKKDVYRMYEEHEMKIMQYTNLKDKDGKEIYEGDILKNNKKNWEVYWDEDGYWGMRLVISRDITTGRNQIDKIYSEIIGNIYENPELLK